MTTAKDVLTLIKDNEVKYADFRFTDPRGKWQHVTVDISTVDEDTFAEGIMFDGSSIAGWKAINESDMTLMPDPTSYSVDPFFAASTAVLVCDILDPASGQQLAAQWVDANQAQSPPGNGDLFGLALAPDGSGIYYVEDDTNMLAKVSR